MFLGERSTAIGMPREGFSTRFTIAIFSPVYFGLGMFPYIRLFKNLSGGHVRTSCIVLALALYVWMGGIAYHQYQKLSDETNIADLNQKVSRYKQEVGTLPDLNLVELFHKGLTKQRLHRTPYGGFYRLDLKQALVYNPIIEDK